MDKKNLGDGRVLSILPKTISGKFVDDNYKNHIQLYFTLKADSNKIKIPKIPIKSIKLHEITPSYQSFVGENLNLVLKILGSTEKILLNLPDNLSKKLIATLIKYRESKTASLSEILSILQPYPLLLSEFKAMTYYND